MPKGNVSLIQNPNMRGSLYINLFIHIVRMMSKEVVL